MEVRHPISGTSVKTWNLIFLLDSSFNNLGNASCMFVRGTFSFLSGELYRKIRIQAPAARIQDVALKDVKLLGTHRLSQFSFPVCVETGILVIFLLLFVRGFSFLLLHIKCVYKDGSNKKTCF